MAKAKFTKMSESELSAQLSSQIEQSIAYLGGELSFQRERALQYYNGEPVGDLSIQDENRSKVVSRDVSDTVEWVLPAQMKIFMSGDEVVKFEPQGPEDEEAARQATEYCNWVFNKQNEGFRILYTWIKDALIQKTGIVKCGWQNEEIIDRRRVEGISDEEYTLLISDDDVEIVSHTEKMPTDQTEIQATPSAGPPLPAVDPLSQTAAPVAGGSPIHDVEYKRTKVRGRCVIENVAPENFLINESAKSINTAIFCSHREKRTLSDLIEAGFDKDQVMSLPTDDSLHDFNSESVVRRENDLPDDIDNQLGQNKSVWVDECYYRVDFDGDGISELRQIFSVNNGRIILKKDGVPQNTKIDGDPPFVDITPIPQPHKFFGLSLADIIMDIQTTKSVLLRQMLDNTYLANNPRAEISPYVNVDDFLDSRIGGAIRILEGGDPNVQHVKWQAVPPMMQQAISVLEYIDMTKSNRTGVTPYNQGIDSNALNKTASGISQIMGAAQQRIELIARIFAETGIKNLFKKILWNATKYSEKEQIIRLRNKWVQLNPSSWNPDYDVSINVGLGTGNKDQMLMHLQQLIGMQIQAVQMQGGINGPFVTGENLYNSASKVVENMGLKGVDNYFTDPGLAPQRQEPPQPNPELVKIQAQQQSDQAKLQLAAQNDQAKIQLEIEKARAQLELERQKMQHEFAMQEQKLQMEAALKQQQAVMAHEVSLAAKQSGPNFVVGEGINKSVNETVAKVVEPVAHLAEMFAQIQSQSTAASEAQQMVSAALLEAIQQPKQLIVDRGPDGKISSAVVVPANKTV